MPCLCCTFSWQSYLRLLLIVAVVVAALPLLPPPLPVTAGGVVGNGTAASCTEQAFEDALAAGGMITFDCGGPATIPIIRSKLLTTTTSIDGGNLITLSASGTIITPTRIFSITAGSAVTLTNLSLGQGAVIDDGGGAIYNAGTLMLSNTFFYSNSTYLQGGGAIYNAGRLMVHDSRFAGNRGWDYGGTGGAIYNAGELTIQRSMFRQNSALRPFSGPDNASYCGGAIANARSGVLHVDNVEFDENSVTDRLPVVFSGGMQTDGGGGICNYGTATVTASTFATNLAQTAGGALLNEASGILVVQGTTFMLNQASAGGGIANMGQLSISSSTFLTNTSDYPGGAIVSGYPTGTLTMTGSVIQANHSHDGGGVAIIVDATRMPPAQPAGVISTTTFLRNTAATGGAIFFAISYAQPALPPPQLLITGSSFSENTAEMGGGIHTESGYIHMETSRVIRNTAQAGAGIWNNNGSMALLASSFLSNTANLAGTVSIAIDRTGPNYIYQTIPAGGGGLLHTAFNVPTATITIEGSTFAFNRGGSAGGALENYGNVSLTNSTFTQNTAPVGSATAQYSSTLQLVNTTMHSSMTSAELLFTAAAATTTLRNTIVAGGGTSNCSGVVTSEGSSLSNDTSCALTAAGDMSGTDPLLGSLQAATNGLLVLPLRAGSPAIDAGTNQDCPPRDQRGGFRPQGPACDIGAVEFDGQMILGLAPPSAPVGADSFALTVTGSGFDPETQVLWNGQIRPTTYLSATQLVAQIPAGDLRVPAAISITVQTANDRTDAANMVIFPVVAPTPALTGIDPTSIPALSPAFTLTLTGTGFITGVSRVHWNTETLSTTLVSDNLLQAVVPAELLTTTGVVSITVVNPAPGGGVSSPLTVTVTRRSQTIRFNPIPDQTLLVPHLALTATATSGLPVSFQAVGACSVTGTTVYLREAGLCTITASQAGDARYLPTEIVGSFQIRGSLGYNPLVFVRSGSGW